MNWDKPISLLEVTQTDLTDQTVTCFDQNMIWLDILELMQMLPANDIL